MDDVGFHLGCVKILPLYHELVESRLQGVMLGDPGIPLIDFVLSNMGATSCNCGGGLALVLLELADFGLTLVHPVVQTLNLSDPADESRLNLLHHLRELLGVNHTRHASGCHRGVWLLHWIQTAGVLELVNFSLQPSNPLAVVLFLLTLLLNLGAEVLQEAFVVADASLRRSILVHLVIECWLLHVVVQLVVSFLVESGPHVVHGSENIVHRTLVHVAAGNYVLHSLFVLHGLHSGEEVVDVVAGCFVFLVTFLSLVLKARFLKY